MAKIPLDKHRFTKEMKAGMKAAKLKMEKENKAFIEKKKAAFEKKWKLMDNKIGK